MFKLLLVAFLTTILGAAPAEDEGALRELLSAQKSLRASCEEGLRGVLRDCGPGSAKWREAQILYHTTQGKTNTFLDTMIMDVRANDLDHDRTARVREAAAAAMQLSSYLDLARCDGTAAQSKGLFLLPLLLKIPSLISSITTGLKLQKAAKGEVQAKRQRTINDLESMKWRAPEEFITRLAPALPGVAPAGVLSREVSGEGPALPRFLRLEGGFHSAPIRQMALSADEGILVTAAEDKTVRVWAARSLECLRVLRPPMGPGDCGKLYAVALSPDGATAVAAGFTQAPEGGSHHVYLLDVRDGHLVREIPGLPEVVNRLSLAPDGATVVVHLGGTAGLRMYRLADGAEVARDPLFGGPSYAGAFAADGRFAASSEDGFVRLYAPDFKLLAKARVPGPSPFGLAFSPDGATLAVGCAEGCRVDLLSAKTLFPVARVDTAGAGGPLGIVAWSRDGSHLFACGGVDFGPRPNALYCWREAGKGPRTEVPLARATLCDLLPLKDGGLLAAAQDPKLCRLDADLKVSASVAAMPGDLDLARERLLVDAAGSVVGLGWRFPGLSDSAYSLHSLGLDQVREGLVPPLTTSPQLKVEAWRDGEKPTLNGAPLQGLEPHEVVRSLSLARNVQSFALGTDWCLRLFDAQGRLERSVPLPAACWGLNHTPDGRLILAALADGTVHWYSRLDGRELMALFVHPDGRRWVLWSPEGYYSASVGGEGLLGWHVQRPGEAGDFFPLNQFRDPFCQPALFTAMLKTLDSGQALLSLGLPRPTAAAAPLGNAVPDLAMPPALDILEPAEGSVAAPGPAAFRVLVRSYGAPQPVKAWHIYLDGEKLPSQRGLPPRLEAQSPGVRESLYTVEVPLPDRECRVSIALETGNGVSEAAQVRLAARPAPAAGLMESLASRLAGAPALNLVSVGISDYQEAPLKLTYPAKDARDVAGIFQGQRAKLYSDVRAHVLVDQQATKANILATLREVRDQAKASDVTVIFLSGHGLSNASSNSYFFLPVDADPLSEATMVDGRDIRDILGQAQGKVVMLLDTCHSGNVLGEGKMRGLDTAIQLTRFINELTSADNGVMVFSSSTGRQLSLEYKEWENGAFTKALREGLGGKADPDHSGRVTLSMLDTYLRMRVAELTHGSQTPVSGKPSTALEFPLVVTSAQ